MGHLKTCSRLPQIQIGLRMSVRSWPFENPSLERRKDATGKAKTPTRKNKARGHVRKVEGKRSAEQGG